MPSIAGFVGCHASIHQTPSASSSRHYSSIDSNPPSPALGYPLALTLQYDALERTRVDPPFVPLDLVNAQQTPSSSGAEYEAIRDDSEAEFELHSRMFSSSLHFLDSQVARFQLEHGPVSGSDRLWRGTSAGGPNIRDAGKLKSIRSRNKCKWFHFPRLTSDSSEVVPRPDR